jgi:mRNA interferase RelE/StbE
MHTPEAYEVRLTKAAVKQLRSLNQADRTRTTDSLKRHAAQIGRVDGSRGGNALKKIRGRGDDFYRLRIGGFRVLFDLIHKERVLLVHGILNRRDLERWLRAR